MTEASDDKRPEPWNLLPAYRVRSIRRLRRDGFSIRAIAVIVGVSTTTAFKYLSDPSLTGKENSRGTY